MSFSPKRRKRVLVVVSTFAAVCPLAVYAMLPCGPHMTTNADLHHMRLCEAAKEGCVRTVISELSHNIDINKRDIRGRLPLMAAIRSGNLPMVRLLLAAGAHPGYVIDGLTVEPLERSVASDEVWDEMRRMLNKVSAYIRAHTSSFFVGPEAEMYRDLPPLSASYEARALRCFIRAARQMHEHKLAFCLRCAGQGFVTVNGDRLLPHLHAMGIDWQTAQHTPPCPASMGIVLPWKFTDQCPNPRVGQLPNAADMAQ